MDRTRRDGELCIFSMKHQALGDAWKEISPLFIQAVVVVGGKSSLRNGADTLAQADQYPPQWFYLPLGIFTNTYV